MGDRTIVSVHTTRVHLQCT